MSQLPAPRPNIISRLQKVRGQIRGIEKMVADERDCFDIVVQLSAARAAIESVAALVLQNYTHICLKRRAEEEGEFDAAADLAHAVAIWVGGRGRGRA